MIVTNSTQNSENMDYIPLQRKFRYEAPASRTFCERQEFSIKFACMVIFALSLILSGALFSEMLQDDRSVNYN